MVKRITAVVMVSVLIFLLSGCTNKKEQLNDEWEQFGTGPANKIGLVITSGEKGEAGAVERLAAAVKKAAADQGIESKVLYPGELANDKEALTYLAENDFKLVIAYGKGIEKPLSQVAPLYPDIRFAVIGGEVDKSNVTSIKIDQSEGAFLAGVAAGSLTKSNVVGFLGGIEAEDSQLATGFARGVYFANLLEGKKTKVNTIYAGVTGQAAQDPNRGYNLANTLFWSGSDVIFCTAGKMDNGAVKSAIENRKVVLASEIKLMGQYPWNVYASLDDKSENAVSDLVKNVLAGKLAAGRMAYGVKEGVVEIQTSEAMPQEIRNRLQDIKNKLKSGQVKPYALKLPNDMVTEINQVPLDLSKQPAGQSGVPRTGAGQSGSGGNKQTPNNPVPNNSVPNNPVQNNPAQNNPVPNNPAPNNTVPNNPTPNNPTPNNPVPNNQVPNNPVSNNPTTE